MIIKKMTAHFGTLEGAGLELGSGLNVLYAPNESGKSTWCAFLRAMLYGVDTAQRVRQGQQPDKKKYLPWSGSPMSGSMDVETEEGPITLRRWTERANQPMQAFSATVTGTDVPVAGMTGQSAGQTLTGAPREVFERSAFIHQAGLGLTNDPELEKRFAAIVSAGDEEQSYSETDKRLRAWLRRRRSGRRGAVPEAEAEIARIEGELARIEQASQAVGRLEQELTEALARQGELVRQMEKARSEARRKALADLAAARADVTAAQERLAQAQEEKARTMEELQDTAFGVMGPQRAEKQVRADMDELKELSRQEAALPPLWMGFIPLGIAGALWAASVFLPRYPLAVIAGGAVFLALAAGVWFWRKKVLARQEELRDRRAYILEEYGVETSGDIRALLDEYGGLWAEAQNAARSAAHGENALEAARRRQKAAEEPVLNGLDFVHGDSEAARASRAVTQGQERIEQLRERRAMAEGQAKAMGDAMVLRSELQERRGRLETLLIQEEALELACETMEQADGALREKFSPMLAEKAAALFGALTAGRYDEITLARDLSAKTRRAGDAVGREADFLSQGARDQLYLALRLAVCSLVLPEDKACPIVLDDALAAFDQERMGRALELLKTVAEKRQVLLFTCHRREPEYFADDPAVTVRTLGA